MTRRLPLDGVPLAQRPPQVTLSDAQRRIAAVCPGLTIDWARPSEEALRVLLRASDLCLRRAEVEAVYEVLMAYAAHLAFQEGRDFELAAVQRAQGTSLDANQTPNGRRALSDFGALLSGGLHHAESDPAPQRGDVWRIGLMVASDAEVRCVHPETGNLTVAALHGDRRHKVVSAAKFISNRRLVRREWKEV